MSPFEVVYGFNPFTPLDLLPLPNPQTFVHKESATKAEFVKKMHEKVKAQIQQQSEKYVKYNNKGKREIIFEECDLVWLHLRKDRFLTKRSLNLFLVVMDLSKSSKESITMLINLNCL